MKSSSAATLKCIIAWSDARNLCGLIERALETRIAEQDVVRLNEDSCLVYTDEATSDIREWIAPELREGDSVLVMEFETWSGYGLGVDSRWLMRRGH